MNRDQKNVFLNAINLCNYRNMILKLFEDKNIETIHYPTMQNLKNQKKNRNQDQNLRKSIEERTKMRRQNKKSDDQNQ